MDEWQRHRLRRPLSTKRAICAAWVGKISAYIIGWRRRIPIFFLLVEPIMIRQGNPLIGNNPHRRSATENLGFMQPTHTIKTINWILACVSEVRYPARQKSRALIHIFCRIFLSLHERLTEDETAFHCLVTKPVVILYIQGHMRDRCAH